MCTPILIKSESPEACSVPSTPALDNPPTHRTLIAVLKIRFMERLGDDRCENCLKGDHHCLISAAEVTYAISCFQCRASDEPCLFTLVNIDITHVLKPDFADVDDRETAGDQGRRPRRNARSKNMCPAQELWSTTSPHPPRLPRSRQRLRPSAGARPLA